MPDIYYDYIILFQSMQKLTNLENFIFEINQWQK